MHRLAIPLLLSATLLVGGCGRKPQGPVNLTDDLGAPPIGGTVSARSGLSRVQPAIADPAAFRAGRGPSSREAVRGSAPDRGIAGMASPPASGSGAAGGGQPGHPGPTLVPPVAPPGPEDDPAPSVYITAIVGRNGALTILVVDKVTGASRWAGVGDVVFGYTVRYVTLRGAVLERGGRQWVLAIGEGRPQEASAPAPSATGEGHAAEETEETPPPAEPTTQERFYGRWRGSDDGVAMEVTFNPGGSGRMGVVGMGESASFTWRLVGPTLYLAVAGEDEDAVSYRFADNYRTLYLAPQGDDEIRLTKQ